ncbi:hypothetical protein HJFPF1_01923 [Paramyrothecium foliicola]|nr:hypothetical protein HJFPF1_01923 [Paramyrothecium foliicola]
MWIIGGELGSTRDGPVQRQRGRAMAADARKIYDSSQADRYVALRPDNASDETDCGYGRFMKESNQRREV